MCFCSGKYWSFISMFRNSLRISCNAGLMVMNSLSDCLSGRYFISPSIMKLSWTGNETLHWNFFSLRLPKPGYQSFLDCKTSAEKFVVSLIEFRLYMIWSFSLVDFKIYLKHVPLTVCEYMPWWSSFCIISHKCSLDLLYLVS